MSRVTERHFFRSISLQSENDWPPAKGRNRTRQQFALFAGGTELCHSFNHAGDDANNDENLEWLNSLREVRANIPLEDVGKRYMQVAEFLSNFHSPVEDGDYAWNQDMEYTDYQWWLGHLEDGRWEIASWGY